MTPVEVVQQYLHRMQIADPTVVDLFSEHSQLVGLGSRVVGKAAVVDFYRSAQEDGQAMPELIATAEAGDRVFAELQITIEGGSVLHVVDVFVIRDGFIETLTYYLADDGT